MHAENVGGGNDGALAAPTGLLPLRYIAVPIYYLYIRAYDF